MLRNYQGQMVKYQSPASTFSIQAQVSVEGFCVVENAYLDLTFGHTETVSSTWPDNDLEWL